MIIKTVKGDLLQRAIEGNYYAIVHGCNCFNTMGAGIAKQIKIVFPEAYNADQATKKGDKKKLGSYTFGIVDRGISSFLVINAYTQYDYRGKNNVDYKAIKSIFIDINKHMKNIKPLFDRNYPPLIGIPKIGAGLAGGDWDEIKGIIDKVTPDIDIELVEYNG